MILPYLFMLLQPNIDVNQDPQGWVLDNGHVRLSLDRATGRVDMKWGETAALASAYGEVLIAGRSLRTTDLTEHDLETEKVRDEFGQGVRAVFRHRTDGRPELRQTFWVYDGKPEAFAKIEMVSPTVVGSNRMAPLLSDAPVRFETKSTLHSLFVPYDNDNYFRYHSDWWGEGEGNEDGSYEVGAIYDDETRRGLVVGSIDHDLWKSAIRFVKDGGMWAVAGVASKYTHDKEEHGHVYGRTIGSPRFVLGLYEDWRTGLERYGDLNAIVQPPLEWKGEVPFGWNSWSGHKTKVQANHMEAAREFIEKDLPWLRTGGTAYVNFDSFWDNLTREQRVDFVKKTHASGLKAGIYWTPFVNWGEPDWNTSGGFKFGDLQLKDSKGVYLPKLDSGWPLDPTHPGTLKRIEENIADFVDQGFDYIKLDFMTHGALEGRHHDPKVTTGTAAYRIGMQKVLDELAKAKRPIFVSLSIAPMFPHGYGHSRRISCDVFSNIGASEYFLNSQNYGWWTAGRLYQFNDPDSACVYQALGENSTTEAEARTRFTASVIGGGMMIEGDDLTNPVARERVLRIFSNKEALELAKKTPQFRPYRGDTAEKAGDAFVYREGDDIAYVAAFNFSQSENKKHALRFDRLDLPIGTWTARELWSNNESTVREVLELDLPPTDCALVRLTRVR